MENDAMYRRLEEVDPDVASAIDNEVRRQHEGLELIASENFVSEAVLEAMGSVFTNKYAEGYPGKRYYGGCEYADVVEELARERAKKQGVARWHGGCTKAARTLGARSVRDASKVGHGEDAAEHSLADRHRALALAAAR